MKFYDYMYNRKWAQSIPNNVTSQPCKDTVFLYGVSYTQSTSVTYVLNFIYTSNFNYFLLYIIYIFV